jgi:hypothetical protein
MNPISKIGPMCLLKIKLIVERYNGERTIYIIHFDDCILAVTTLHSFVLVDGYPKKVLDLKGGDCIWVDVSAFMADGSFSKKPPVPKGHPRFPGNRIISEDGTSRLDTK